MKGVMNLTREHQKMRVQSYLMMNLTWTYPYKKEEKKSVYKMFNEKVDKRNVELSIGLRFTSREIFKEAILAYSIQQHKDLIYIKNDKKYIHLGCSLCKWELTAGPDLNDVHAWQIKSMQPIHDCLRTMNNRLITENWLSQEYLDRILRDPLMTPAQIKSDMKARYEIVVGSRKCERAKERALNAVTTLMKRQYGILKPYLVELVKSIVSMLEDIRMAIMDRMRKKRLLVSQFVAGVAPRISLKLEESYNEQNRCECKWNGDDTQCGFEVIHNGVSHAVDIIKRTCSCRSWELTGIPCCHGMSALLYMQHKPENFLPKWYTLETYNQTYSNCLKPVPGITFWEHEGEGMVLPPDIVKSKSGSRRKKARRRDVDETPKNKRKFSRSGLPIKCSKCGEQGHDKRKCTIPTNSTQTQNCESQPSSSTRIGPARTWNRGRKKGGKNRLGRTSNDVPSPSEYYKMTRGNKEARRVAPNEGNTSTSWLDALAAKKAKGRGRGI